MKLDYKFVRFEYNKKEQRYDCMYKDTFFPENKSLSEKIGFIVNKYYRIAGKKLVVFTALREAVFNRRMFKEIEAFMKQMDKQD